MLLVIFKIFREMKYSIYLIIFLIAAFKDFFKNILKYASLRSSNPTLRLGNNVKFSNKSIFGIFNRLSHNVCFYNSTIDNYSYIGQNSFVQHTRIGKFICIGPGVKIGLGEHPTSKFVSLHPVFYSKAKQIGVSFSNEQHFVEHTPVEIGHDVWIGANVVVRCGVKIGNGCIIGAGAVVTKDVPDYAIYGGVPAKLIHMRFTEVEIQKLQKIEWWNSFSEKLKAISHLMLNIQNITSFETEFL
jgi:acetyltransferase-like isoleucine patch superfamily enzyme